MSVPGPIRQTSQKPVATPESTQEDVQRTAPQESAVRKVEGIYAHVDQTRKEEEIPDAIHREDLQEDARLIKVGQQKDHGIFLTISKLIDLAKQEKPNFENMSEDQKLEAVDGVFKKLRDMHTKEDTEEEGPATPKPKKVPKPLSEREVVEILLKDAEEIKPDDIGDTVIVGSTIFFINKKAQQTTQELSKVLKRAKPGLGSKNLAKAALLYLKLSQLATTEEDRYALLHILNPRLCKLINEKGKPILDGEGNEEIGQISEYFENGDLYDTNTGTKLTQEQRFKNADDSIRVMLFLHKYNHTHFDIKPENILHSDRTGIKFCDTEEIFCLLSPQEDIYGYLEQIHTLVTGEIPTFSPALANPNEMFPILKKMQEIRDLGYDQQGKIRTDLSEQDRIKIVEENEKLKLLIERYEVMVLGTTLYEHITRELPYEIKRGFPVDQDLYNSLKDETKMRYYRVAGVWRGEQCMHTTKADSPPKHLKSHLQASIKRGEISEEQVEKWNELIQGMVHPDPDQRWTFQQVAEFRNKM